MWLHVQQFSLPARAATIRFPEISRVRFLEILILICHHKFKIVTYRRRCRRRCATSVYIFGFSFADPPPRARLRFKAFEVKLKTSLTSALAPGGNRRVLLRVCARAQIRRCPRALHQLGSGPAYDPRQPISALAQAVLAQAVQWARQWALPSPYLLWLGYY